VTGQDQDVVWSNPACIDLKDKEEEISVLGKRRRTNDARRSGQANGQNQVVYEVDVLGYTRRTTRKRR
jgi:hypothetical protein